MGGGPLQVLHRLLQHPLPAPDHPGLNRGKAFVGRRRKKIAVVPRAFDLACPAFIDQKMKTQKKKPTPNHPPRVAAAASTAGRACPPTPVCVCVACVCCKNKNTATSVLASSSCVPRFSLLRCSRPSHLQSHA